MTDLNQGTLSGFYLSLKRRNAYWKFMHDEVMNFMLSDQHLLLNIDSS